MTAIDINALTPEQRADLLKQAEEINKKEKEQRDADRKTFKELSEDYVLRIVDKIIDKHFEVEEIVKFAFAEYEPIKQLKAQAYSTKVNEQDSHTSTLADGSASITIGWNVSIGFDGTESAGVEKIKDFINSLADESEKVKKLEKMVNTFLKPNAKTGMLNPSKIIELSRLKDEFNDERFNEGLDIIFNAQIRRQNSMYISGWKFIKTEDEQPKKVEFRFTV